uniref:Nucleotide exchange factor Fes1 domain-containing protein n=1 Tax=Craspedostauros australis TaxID=1486917 RepID=A0A7R9WLP4_9STRA|mmetsp:Transcript_10976/g.30327  ORF Transcript_10976/g.30327 Transcript_10976/m.30327 type:complete len:365 (+) Transcript_10976:256-1350(+)|eukprot:CAMPEP_0198118842 /NCGR_PEP_ID=MMETSP1442-20131203/23277_1 /TAXON_ID= /ORGANISM="Craspedostauros australis, Strain CCMP3328" /LENGTH=364 /DNA_ID=CAMNT_0043777175 /DNA_START=230 /DNA_END=1324 /DNA_ORIENTATION=-
MSGGPDPWAWMGLLKWSLSYSDGTSDASNVTPMSEEDKAFLEMVMKEGIINENDRMRTILKQLTDCMDHYQRMATSQASSSKDDADGAATSKEDGKADEPPVSDEELEGLLQELRDIVEQIDYARAFMSMKGLPFLLGGIQEREAVPEAIRGMCLGLISTLCQNNPPVQKELLELGALKSITDMYFSEKSGHAMKAKYMQAMSSIVRSHELAENVMDGLDQTVALFVDGLNPTTSTDNLKRRTLFFLHAYVTSDTATAQRVKRLAGPVGIAADYFLEESPTNSPEIREMTLALLQQILEQEKSVDSILQRKTGLVALGVQRISALRKLTGDEKEYATAELEGWESLIRLLSRATPDELLADAAK